MNRGALIHHSARASLNRSCAHLGRWAQKNASAASPLHFSDLPMGRETPLEEIFSYIELTVRRRNR
jgi:hypothetical protein